MIELKDISIDAGDFSLERISFKVDTGQFAVLMGRTGRGKTTLLEIICGLRTPSGGTVVIHGQNVTDWSPADREIGYVPQDLALFPMLSVSAHLEFALRLRKHRRKEIAARVTELAHLLKIEHLLKRSVKDLSGGEAQRVAIGRALSFRPRVLLLDEPLSALDSATRGDIQQMLKTVKQATGVTTLHVTHNIAEATVLADTILTLEDGVVSAQEATAES
jgi:ABC-type sugar transport system ATPase subunit